ncbi:MAG: exopolyphosphatase [bacterium]|nr:exopolyphosphatase [bacterium]
MRIVTRPDFDGIVCAVLLRNVLDITEPIFWVEPYEIKERSHEIGEGDIVANLPYVENCSLWFDHHHTNQINQTERPFAGAFKIAPSAAGVIYEYYHTDFSRDFRELVTRTDKIDSGDISIEEVLHPENYPYILLSTTISGSKKEDEYYWNKIVDLLGREPIETILTESEVCQRYTAELEQDKQYAEHLKKHTSIKNNIGITDFRDLEVEPKGNRFLIYSLYPDIYTDVKIRFKKDNREKVIVSLGQSIFNRQSKVHLGAVAAKYGGGGHFGAGSCAFHIDEADEKIPEILAVLYKNKNIN